MHAEYDIRSLRHELRRVEQAEVLPTQSGIELAQKVRAFSLSTNLHVALFVCHARHGVLHPLRSWGPDNRPHMVYGLRVAWTQIGSNYPQILREIRFDENALVVDGSGRRQWDVLWHFNDHVRLDAPAVHERYRWRGVFRVAFLGAAVHPRDQCLDGGVAQRPIIGKMTVGWICKPRRHLTAHDSGFDGFRPRPRVLVTEE